MTPAEIVEYATSHGVRLSVAGDRLRVVARRGLLTKEFRETLKSHKREILATLSSRNVSFCNDLATGPRDWLNAAPISDGCPMASLLVSCRGWLGSRV